MPHERPSPASLRSPMPAPPRRARTSSSGSVHSGCSDGERASATCGGSFDSTGGRRTRFSRRGRGTRGETTGPMSTFRCRRRRRTTRTSSSPASLGMRRWLLAALLPAAVAGVASAQGPNEAPALAHRVEVRRTTFGVPHIRAEDLEAAAYALAYVQLEDHGPRVAIGLLRARGEMGRWFGRDSMESDFTAKRDYALAV